MPDLDELEDDDNMDEDAESIPDEEDVGCLDDDEELDEGCESADVELLRHIAAEA